MDDLIEREPVAIEIERDIRIAIWNACCWQGKPQAIAQSFIGKAMEEPTMAHALARIAALEADKARLMGLVKEAGEALGDMESRVEMASKWIHNSQDWKVDEYEPGLKIWDWLFRDTRAALAKIKETPDG